MATRTITPASANAYRFLVSGVTVAPTSGAVYTNNGISYTVVGYRPSVYANSAVIYATGSGAPTVSGTLTKTSGTGDSTISFSGNAAVTLVSQYTWTSGDLFTVTTRGELVIDIDTGIVGKKFGQITAITDMGIVCLENYSNKTNSISLNAATDFLKVSGAGYFNVYGQPIQIGTGSGADGQTVDLTTANATGAIQTTIDAPAFLEVETGSGTGVYEPYFPIWYRTTISCNTHTTTTIDGIADTTHLHQYMGVSGSGIPAGATIVSVAVNSVVISAAATSTLTGTAILFYDVGGAPTTEIGIGVDLGRYFIYDSAKNLATFGQVAATAWGKVPPNGAKIRYVNIHFTSAGYSNVRASRSLLWVYSGGSANISNFGCSNAIYLNSSSAWFQATTLTINNMGMFADFGGGNNLNGVVNINKFYVSLDRDTVSSVGAISIVPANQNTSIQNMYGIMSALNSTNIQLQLIKPQTIDSIYGVCLNKAGTNTTAINITFKIPDKTNPTVFIASNLYVIGGRLNLNQCASSYINHVRFSDQNNGITGTFAQSPITSGGTNVAIAVNDFTLAVNGAPHLTSTFMASDATNESVFIGNVTYDGLNGGVNRSGAFTINGQRAFAWNISATHIAGSASIVGNSFSASGRGRIANAYTDSVASGTSAQPGLMCEWVVAPSMQGAAQNYPDSSMFNTAWTNVAKTTGALFIGGFNGQSNFFTDEWVVNSGVLSTDQVVGDYYLNYQNPSGIVWLSQMVNNTDFTVFSKFAIRGIQDFSGSTITYNAIPTNVTLTYKLWDARPGVVEPSSWTTLSGANLQTSLSDTVNSFPNGSYSPTIGFYMKLRIQASAGAIPPNTLNRITITCTPPSSWTVTEAGFIPVGVSGAVSGSAISVYDNTVPASPVLIASQTVPASGISLVEYPFTPPGPAPYKIVVRKAGYQEIVVTGNTYQIGKTVPVSQVLNYAITDAAVSGVSYDGTTNTITISANVTPQQIYQGVQHISVQNTTYTDAMIKGYPVPLTTTDNVSFAGNVNMVVNTGCQITGSGKINIGTGSLTMSGTAQSSADITYNSGANVWTRVTVSGFIANSFIRITNTTDNIHLYNAVASGTSVEVQTIWSADKALSVFAEYWNSTTAKLSTSASTTFKSTGASATLSQIDDTYYNLNAIDGSTCPEFTMDYPHLRLDVSSSGGVTDARRAYAYFVYSKYSAQGIVYLTAGITAQSQNMYIVNTSVLDLHIVNLSSGTVAYFDQKKGVLRRDDNTPIIYNDGTYGSIEMQPFETYTADSDELLRLAKYNASK